MDAGTTLSLMIGGLVLLLVISVPVAFAFVMVNAVGAWMVFGGEAGLIQMTRNSVTSLSNYALAPIPLFIFMGEILFHTGVAQKAIDAVDRAINRVPARLSVVTIVGGTIFAALSGSSIANAALLGKTMLPEMLKKKYHPTLAMGPIMASGALAILIPPSALAVLLGSLAKISIAKLLVAGIVPALLMAFGFLVLVVGAALVNPSLAPSEAGGKLTMRERALPLITDVMPLSLILAAVVGSLLTGLATPSESAAFGCVAAVIVCALYRAITLPNLWHAVMETLALSTMILFIVLASQTFSQILAFSGATQTVVSAVTDAVSDPFWILAGIIAILLVLGCFVDQISMMMLTLPIIMPLAQFAHIDLILLGIVYLLTMEIGLLTPPFGLILFVMKGVSPPEISTRQVYAAVTPFLVIKLGVLTLIVLMPGIADWLPALVAP